MKRSLKQLKAWVLILVLAIGNLAALSGRAQAQARSRIRNTQTATAYDHGYADGYDDGYRQGKSDNEQDATRDHKRSQLYKDADRGYETRLGSLADYREGYRLGFEIAYTDGYYGRTLNQRTPSNARRIALRLRDRARTGSVIPADTALRIRLTTSLSSKTNNEGDRFTARVFEPPAYEGATVEGYIARIERSGKMTGHTEMALDFDTITFRTR
jgi:hypothetical protein